MVIPNQKLNFFTRSFIITILLVLIVKPVSAQYGTKAQLRNIDFNLVDDKVLISYDIIDAKRKELFDINIEVFNSAGYKIDAQTLEGNFTDVTRGRNKEIKWYLGEDYPNFEDNIYIKLTAIHKNHMRINQISRIEAIGKSTLYPGWGSAQMTLRNSCYVHGAFAYGFLGLSAYFKHLSNEDKWRAANAIDNKKENLYNTNAQLYQDFCYFTLGLAGFLWLVEYNRVLFSPNISKKIKFDYDVGSINNKVVPMLSFKVNLSK